MKYWAIEAGWTKFICWIGNEKWELDESSLFSIDTTSPDETISKVNNYFKDKPIDSLWLWCFGPIDLDTTSKTYWYITSTPKLKWKNFDIVWALKKWLDVDIAFDTDVNAAALAESKWGNAKGLDSCIYLTIWTWIWWWAYVEWNLVHWMMHPEMWHILLRNHPHDRDTEFTWVCPYHKNCFEWLASWPSIEKRWNRKAIDLPDIHPAWKIEAFYISQAIMNYIMILSPQKIIIWWWVMQKGFVFDMIHKNIPNMLWDYIQNDNVLSKISDYIVYPKFGQNAWIIWSLSLNLRNK